MISSGDKTFENFDDYLNYLANEKESIGRKIYNFFLRKKHEIRDIYYEIKYGFQRMFRGYDDVEIFNTFDIFLKRYTKILKDFRRCKNSYSPRFNSCEEWDVVLDEMISHFELSDEFNSNYKDVAFSKASQLAYEHGNKALEMFVEYFWDLWD